MGCCLLIALLLLGGAAANGDGDDDDVSDGLEEFIGRPEDHGGWLDPDGGGFKMPEHTFIVYGPPGSAEARRESIYNAFDLAGYPALELYSSMVPTIVEWYESVSAHAEGRDPRDLEALMDEDSPDGDVDMPPFLRHWVRASVLEGAQEGDIMRALKVCLEARGYAEFKTRNWDIAPPVGAWSAQAGACPALNGWRLAQTVFRKNRRSGRKPSATATTNDSSTDHAANSSTAHPITSTSLSSIDLLPSASGLAVGVPATAVSPSGGSNLTKKLHLGSALHLGQWAGAVTGHARDVAGAEIRAGDDLETETIGGVARGEGESGEDDSLDTSTMTALQKLAIAARPAPLKLGSGGRTAGTDDGEPFWPAAAPHEVRDVRKKALRNGWLRQPQDVPGTVRESAREEEEEEEFPGPDGRVQTQEAEEAMRHALGDRKYARMVRLSQRGRDDQEDDGATTLAAAIAARPILTPGGTPTTAIRRPHLASGHSAATHLSTSREPRVPEGRT
jgi:hypothetical protein